MGLFVVWGSGGMGLSSSVLCTTIISSQKPSVVPGNGPGTSNDTKNLPDVSMGYISSLVNNRMSVRWFMYSSSEDMSKHLHAM